MKFCLRIDNDDKYICLDCLSKTKNDFVHIVYFLAQCLNEVFVKENILFQVTVSLGNAIT
jgi:hypothetical protein